MRVRCERIIRFGEELAEHPGIAVGEEFVVLMVVGTPKYGAELLVHYADGNPVQWPAAMFTTTDGHVPSTWRAQVDEDGWLTIGPEEWLEPGWDMAVGGRTGTTHDERVAAGRSFRRESEIILRESGAITTGRGATN